MVKGYDFKSEELKKMDLFDGEKSMSKEEYDAKRKKAFNRTKSEINKIRKNAKDVRSNSEILADAKKASKIDVTEYKRILDNGIASERSRGMQSSIKSKISFKDVDGRVVDFIETKKGALSIQFWFFKDDNLGLMHQALYAKFGQSNSIIPKEYKRSVDMLSNMMSVCVFLPPQSFNFGFKTHLMGEVSALVEKRM